MPRIRTPRRPTIFDPDYGNDSDTSSIASLTRALNFISDLDQTARLARDVEDEDEEDSEELDRETEGGSCDCESGYNSEDEVNMNVQNVHEPVALWSNWRQLRDVHFPENITSASFFDEASDIDLDEYDFYSDEEDEDGVWTALENGWSAQVPGIGVHMNVFLQFGNLVIQMVTENGSLYEMEYGALMDPSFDSPVGSVAGRFGRGRRPENVATVAPGAPAV
ncbi:hypothetical protein M501DRAFT_995207 [Patellaria atrata CBS 101060]|uniref:Uncharacterized protein n=1 Tax=Patellaria atrata CBS 101060 TaxID=1346257 RepID=A0A9P4S8P4_9PEZI|nr:hypothetical protein M501DRAFT_995207 [Patellaria atrata CBS 101060]